MSQIILIEKSPDLSKVIRLNLLKVYDLEVVEKATTEEAIELIEILPSIELIVVREASHSEDSMNKLVGYLKSNNHAIPLVVIGKKTYSYSAFVFIDATSSWKVFIDVVGKTLGLGTKDDFQKNDVEFVPIPVSYFLNINETSIGCDVYIRVKKSENNFQYIKRLNSTDFFNREDIERYHHSGLKDFYITKDHFTNFVNFVTDKLTLKLGSAHSLEEGLQIAAETYEVTVDRIAALGVDERTIELVDESIKTMKKSLGNEKALAGFLKNMQANKMSFAYAHSYLICLLLNQVLKHFDWETVAVRDKITYLSYFHDISLKSDLLMRIHSFEELSELLLTKDQNDTVLNHALKSAEILDKFPSVPMGVTDLVREHHGVRNGVGFRTSLSLGISPISMMFVVIEDFVGEFLKLPAKPSLTETELILNKLELEFSKATYAQALKALRVTVLKQDM